MSLSNKEEQTYFLRKFRQEFAKSSLVEATASVAFQASSFAILMAISYFVILTSPAVGWALYPIFLYFLGTRYRALVNVIHECVHNSFTEKKENNLFFGELLSIICFMKFARYKANHVTHHIYTGDAEKDLGFSNIGFYELDIPLARPVVKRHFYRLLTVQMFKDYLGYVIYDSAAPMGWRIARVVWLTGVAAACIYSGPAGVITFLILAYLLAARLIALPVIGYVSDILDHGGMLGHDMDLDKSRNYVVKNRLIAEAFFPRNDCYHLIHHLFPTVPAKWMPTAHALLLKDSAEYREMTHSFADWMKIALRPKSPLAS